jgi:signal transduction histidine kinase
MVKKKSDISYESDYLRFLIKEKDISDQIINNSRSMISIINRNYIYEKVNATFCNEHQIVIDSIIGKTPGDIWGNETFQKSIKSNIDLCLSGKTVRYEASFNTLNFGDRYFEVVFRPLFDKTGNITHILAETFDITDFKRSKLAIAEQDEKFRKFESVGALAAGIAHDLNNILATISGYSEMLNDDLSESSALSEKVSKIQGAVLKARSVTDQILMFNQQSGPEKKLINVSEVLKETIGFIRSGIPPGIILKSRIPKTDAFVFADRTQLFRVFLNLMTNAVQAMEKEGGTLSVKLAIIDGKLVKHELNKDSIAEEYALLTFKDKGKGIEPSIIARVFEPFFTTREAEKGTGLGLSIVHRIVTEMNGTILITSKKQKGSTFYVYIPVSRNY